LELRRNALPGNEINLKTLDNKPNLRHVFAMNEEIAMKLIPPAQRLYNIVMDELDERCEIYEENFFSDEDKYHILRYLTNMLETEEAQLHKKLNKNHD
jgi:hypothetical protein